MTISIYKNGVRITPSPRTPSAEESAAAAGAAQRRRRERGVSLAKPRPAPPRPRVALRTTSASRSSCLANADSDDVREAVQEAKAAVVEAIRESRHGRRKLKDAANVDGDRSRHRVGRRVGGVGRQGRAPGARRALRRLPDPARLVRLILASTILKITYKGQKLAEVKAAVATETAESEQLKRQVVEARMAAMQAQVEPHFLFNTLASIDHLIETDPPRASQMQET